MFSKLVPMTHYQMREKRYHGNKEYLWPVAILVVTLCIAHQVAGQCDVKSEFRCANEVCVNISKVNNSVNDCGDNSDEVVVPCRTPAFTCLDGICVMPPWVLDGIGDCKDMSDEAKIIGTRCDMIKECCHCDFYVAHSNCHDNTTCQCDSGFYSNQLGTECIRRVINDSCAQDSDCYDAFSNSNCFQEHCICDVGYYPSADGKTCISRVVGDFCMEEADCLTVIPNSNCTQSDNICNCNSGYYHSEDLSTCIKRRVGDSCSIDSDCLDAVLHTHCHEGRCHCKYGYIDDDEGTVCRRRILGDPCRTTWECVISILGDSYCSIDHCSCYDGDKGINEGRRCVTRVLGDTCEEDRDCSPAVKNAKCISNICKCSTEYLKGADGNSCVYQWQREDTAILASSIVIISVLAFLCITLTLWLAFKLFPALKSIAMLKL